MKMYSFKKADAGMVFIGFDDNRKVFSRNYYANVGLLNCDEPMPVKLKELKAIENDVVSKGYEEVTYLKGTCYQCKYFNACGDNHRTERCDGKEYA